MWGAFYAPSFDGRRFASYVEVARRAESAEQRIESAEQRAAAAEAELARLRDLLRLQGIG